MPYWSEDTRLFGHGPVLSASEELAPTRICPRYCRELQGSKGTYDVYPGAGSRTRGPSCGLSSRTGPRPVPPLQLLEVRTPIFEEAELFVRSVGEASDIVRKEMFVFEDKGGRELALRPEGTAVGARYVEHGLYTQAQPLKLFYVGPMFRYEQQQRRYRQHTQIGVEVLGSADPLVDVEVISPLLHPPGRRREGRDRLPEQPGRHGDAQAYVLELRAAVDERLDPTRSR